MESKRNLILHEEEKNTRWALENSENSFTADSLLGQPAPEGAKRSEAQAALCKQLQNKAHDVRAESLYEMIKRYMEAVNARLKVPYESEPDFYTRTDVGYSVWSSIRRGCEKIDENTVFKLALGLQLNCSEARELLFKGTGERDFKQNPLHQTVTECLINGIYDIETVYERLEKRRLEAEEEILEGRLHAAEYLNNIYDSRSEKAEKRKAFKERLNAHKEVVRRDVDSAFEKRMQDLYDEMSKLSSTQEARMLYKKIEHEMLRMLGRKHKLMDSNEKITQLIADEQQIMETYASLQARDRELDEMVSVLFERFRMELEQEDEPRKAQQLYRRVNSQKGIAGDEKNLLKEKSSILKLLIQKEMENGAKLKAAYTLLGEREKEFDLLIGRLLDDYPKAADVNE